MNESVYDVKKKKIKTYPLESLLDPFDLISARCEQIVKVSSELDFIPKTTITINETELCYIQEYVFRKSFKNVGIEEKKHVLERFADGLESLYDQRFVHGDIHHGNIIYDGCRLNLIDLEPSFWQKKMGRKVLVSASSLRSANDRKRRKISYEADKIGFYRYTKKIFIEKLAQPFDSIPESELVTMKYRNILNVLKKNR